jgi:hypothetical protein
MSEKGRLTTLLSVCAIVVSLLTLGLNTYNQYLKGPKVTMILGDRAGFAYTKSLRLRFYLGVTLFNEGARYATSVKIVGRLRSLSGGPSDDVRWVYFCESKNIGEIGKTVRPHEAFDGYVQTVVIPGRSAVVKEIAFVTNEPFALVPGAYELDLTVLGGPGLERIAHATNSFNFSEEESAWLRDKCVANAEGVSEHGVTLWRKAPQDEDGIF